MKQLTYKPEVFRGLGRNMMTPDILGYYRLRDGFAELSKGSRIMGSGELFGVTVRPDTSPRLSKCCFSEAEALAYIEELS